MTRFQCDFKNPTTGERRVIQVQITSEELEKSGGVDLYRDAYVLRQAYRDGVPSGFLHVRDTIRSIQLQ